MQQKMHTRELLHQLIRFTHVMSTLLRVRWKSMLDIFLTTLKQKDGCFWPHSLASCCSGCMSLDCPVYCHQYTERKRAPEPPPWQVVYSETLALKPWLLYQITQLLTITKMIFFVESSAVSYCPVCGDSLSYRDSCVRIMRLEGGMKRRLLIRT